MMKKIVLFLALCFSLTQITFAQNAFETFKSGYAKTAVGYPTDIYIYNYLLDPYASVIVDAPETPVPSAKIFPYPTVPYYDHIWNSNYEINMRIRLYDRFGYLFYDKYVGSHAVINIYPTFSGNYRVMVSN